MKKLVRALALCGLMAALATPRAEASTLIGLDRQGVNLGLGLGNGAGLALDAGLASGTHLGVQGGTAFGFEVPYYGFCVAQTLLGSTGGFKLGVLLTGYQQRYAAPEQTVTDAGLGLALAYSFSPRWTLRAALGDLLLVYPTVFPNLGVLFDPFTGLELGYRFTPQLEGTLGVNGFEQALGVNYTF